MQSNKARTQGNGTKLCQEGSDEVLEKNSLSWSNTRTDFLDRQLMPYARQCSTGIWTMPSAIQL